MLTLRDLDPVMLDTHHGWQIDWLKRQSQMSLQTWETEQRNEIDGRSTIASSKPHLAFAKPPLQSLGRLVRGQPRLDD